MAKLHFLKSCTLIPEDSRNKLKSLQSASSRASGGKEYWAEGLRVLGVIEDERGFLKFRSGSAAIPLGISTNAVVPKTEEGSITL